MKIRVGIVITSDKGVQGEREDKVTPLLKKLVEGVGWEVVSSFLIPDEPEIIREKLIKLSDEEGVDLILTSGGTGLSPRDFTPEVTGELIEKEVPGIPEAMRIQSLRFTPRAMLSRAKAGIRKKTLIINLPGSPQAVKECWEIIFPSLPHGLKILQGKEGECAR